jgi:phosphotransacetylase
MLIADCAVQPNPTAEQLAEIAYLAYHSAKTF